MSWLRSGQIAVGFVGMRMDEKAFRYVPLLEDHLVLVTENSPCFQDLPAEAGLELLLREPVIVRETASGTWLETEKWLRGQGILPERLHILARMENPDAIRPGSRRGMGVSVLSSLVVEEDAAAGRLRTFELGQGAWRQICMVLPKRAALTATQTAFADFVRAERRSVTKQRPRFPTWFGNGGAAVSYLCKCRRKSAPSGALST